MGRKKASMKLIQGKNAMEKIYKERGDTLKRKAEELSILSGVDLCLIMVPPGENATAETCPKDNPQRIHALIETFQKTRTNDETRCKVKTVSDSIHEWIQGKEVELAKLRKMNLEARFPTSAQVFQGLPEESRRVVATFLSAKIEALKQKINDISLTNIASTSNSTSNLLDLFPAGGEGYYSLPSNDVHAIQQNPMYYDTYNTMYYDNVAMSDQFPQPMTSLPDQYVVEPMYGYYNVQTMPQMEECFPGEVHDLRWDEHARPFSVSDVFQVPKMEHPPISDVFQVPKPEHPYFHMDRSEFYKSKSNG